MTPTSERPSVYTDKNFDMQPVFLSDESYQKALRSFVVVCVDVVLVNQINRTVCLAHRRREPICMWWWIGGRVYAGEGSEEAAVRIFERETSLRIAQEKLSFLCMNEYRLSTRSQEPKNAGVHGLAFTIMYEPTREEFQIISAHLDQDEYIHEYGLREFDREMIARENLHPAVADVYTKVFGI